MESKKTTELRGKKTSVRTKLAAAVAMLLVSTIMLTTTTYAWFVLSTAPEVKGMSTTVGSNGSLEIALLNDSTDTTKITSGVGDSSSAPNKNVTDANITWGNIVDLSSDSYGLNADDMKLYPAALNFAAGSENKKLASIYSILKVPTYGVDGRVNTMNDNTVAGRYVNANFRGDPSYYGVRAIGTGTDADPTALAFQRAKNNFNSQITAAKNQALTSLNANAPGLITLAVKHMTDDAATYQASELTPITNAAESLKKSTEALEAAIQYAYEVYRISQGKNPSDNPRAVSLTEIAADTNVQALHTYIEKYNALVTKINGIVAPTTGTGDANAIVWNDIKDQISKLIDAENLKVGDQKLSKKWIIDNATDFLNGTVLSVSAGAYTDVANFSGTYTSALFNFNVKVPASLAGLDGELKVKNASIEIQMSESVTTSYGSKINGLFGQLTPPEGETTALITDKYGYIVDLAVRCNADTNLLLSADAKNRVADDTATKGAGSTYTVNADTTNAKDLNKVAQALRVVFINNQNDGGYQILGVAGLTATGTTLTANENGSYQLHMYTWETDANGGIKLTGQKADDVITDMQADVAQCISVLVYLDGNYVDYAMGGVSGTLNLQFSSSTTLTPMDYTFTTQP